jgi:lantibiotic modifying enzyme
MGPLRRELAEVSADTERARRLQHPLGGMSGLGSLVYALVKIGDLLSEPAVVADAHRLAGLITEERIADDKSLDVMFGAAGALLALLALHDAMPEPLAGGATPLDVAEACARHLLGQRVSSDGKPRAWPTGPDGSPVGGFAHGAAGICCALFRLFRRTGRTELLTAAAEGIEYERTLFVAGRRDWRISWRAEPHFVNSWCNGAPGIALGRLEALDLLTDPQLDEEVGRALEITASPELEEIDLLCCGNMGRVDLLLHAQTKLGEPMGTAAHSLALRILERAESRGRFTLMASCAHLFDPRLFLGITGIGYTLLRLAAPADVPCVLAMA